MKVRDVPFFGVPFFQQKINFGVPFFGQKRDNNYLRDDDKEIRPSIEH